MALWIAGQPDKIQNGALMEVVDGPDHHHMHDVVGVGQHVQSARNPLFWNSKGSYETTYHSQKVLEATSGILEEDIGDVYLVVYGQLISYCEKLLLTLFQEFRILYFTIIWDKRHFSIMFDTSI